jgi:cytochrome c biogenesis protein CcdA
MLRLTGLVISIGLADSLNPSTIAPALYLASGERPRGSVTEFTISVFLVYLLGGIAIAVGPGRWLFSLIPEPHHHLRHIIETAAGVALIAAAAMLWRHRDRLADRDLPYEVPQRRSSMLLGAGISAVELPTAFPYFAAIAAIVGSGVGPARQIGLLVLFNVCFVLPLIGIVGTLTFAGDRAEQMLAVGRAFLQRHWPAVLALLLVVAGALALALGVTGFAAGGHGRVGRFARRIRGIFHP